MKKYIYTFVDESNTFQHNKVKIVKTPGTVQPLSIPHPIWIDISMDIIIGLPKYGNKLVIVVVVDPLSKCSHLCSLHEPFKSSIVA